MWTTNAFFYRIKGSSPLLNNQRRRRSRSSTAPSCEATLLLIINHLESPLRGRLPPPRRSLHPRPSRLTYSHSCSGDLEGLKALACINPVNNLQLQTRRLHLEIFIIFFNHMKLKNSRTDQLVVDYKASHMDAAAKKLQNLQPGSFTQNIFIISTVTESGTDQKYEIRPQSLCSFE